MISEKQLELAECIKGVHLSLRRRARQIGAEKAWEEHLKNKEVLEHYADCMKNLAENYWAVNNDSKNLCRIKWMVDVAENYFKNGNLEKECKKENYKMQIFIEKGLINKEPENNEVSSQEPYKLLDVGSCYNPFKSYKMFETYPIDLCPASPDVKKCNFLEIPVGDFETDWFSDLKFLPQNYFDIVVFSLFLEYLPSSEQRFLSCKKAYDCLKTNGLLLIVTPDSKHATANSKIMKNWKIALGAIGFVRVSLEKLKYIYCMAFRKPVCKKYSTLLYEINNMDIKPDKMIIIPQDSVDYKVETNEEKEEINSGDKLELFGKLPFC